MAALLEQESGSGRNTSTSIDGARGAGQIMPGTFKQYARNGESIDNADHNLAVMARIVKDLGTKFGDDPARIAAGYFSGAGNVNPGQGSAWKNDHADGNGKRVSGYVADVLRRVGVEPQATTTGPDLSKAPKWADVEANPQFAKLPPEKQAEAKAAYFDYWIAPRAGDHGEALRQQFLKLAAKPNANASLTTDVGNLLGTGVNSMAQNVRELVGRIPGVGRPIVEGLDAVDKWATGKSSDELLKGNVKAAQERLTPEMQAAGNKKWWDSDKGTFGDAWTDPRSYVSGIVQSLPEQALTMIPAMRLAKGIYASKVAAGVAPEVASAAAARAAALAGGASEGALAGAASSREVRDKIMAMKPEQMQGSEALQTLMGQGMTFEQARDAIANDAATQAFITSGVATGMFGGFGDRMLAKAMTEGIGKNFAGRVAKGVVGEGVLEEFPQEALGAVAENAALRHADPSIALTDDALNRGLGGLATGGIQGGAMAGAFGRNQQPTEANVTPDGRIDPDGQDFSQQQDAELISAMRQGAPVATPAQMDGQPVAQPLQQQPAVVEGSHPTSQTADSIVAELAQQAGIPLETVLPTAKNPQQGVPPAAGDQAFSDQDVISYAQNRARYLASKDAGTLDDSVDPFTGETSPNGLSRGEQDELARIQAAGGNVRALREMFGFGAPVVRQTQAPEPVPEQHFPTATEQGLVAATGGQIASTADGQLTWDSTSAGPAIDATSPPGVDQAGLPTGGAVTQQPQGPFATAIDAKRHIRQQRRNSGSALPAALPLPFADGSFGVVLQGTPGWDEASAYEKANRPKTEKEARERKAQEAIDYVPQPPQSGTHTGQTPSTQAAQASAEGIAPSTPGSDMQAPAKPRTEREAKALREQQNRQMQGEAEQEARLEREAIQGEQVLGGDPVADDADIPFDVPAQPVATTGEGAGVSQPMQEQQPKSATGFTEAFDSLKGGGVTDSFYKQAFDALQSGKTTIAGVKDPVLVRAKAAFDAGLIQSADDIRKFESEGYPATPAAEPVAEQPSAPPKPRTEKEAKLQKALDRISRGSAYFAKEGKAREWVVANGLTDTHTVERDASGANKWNIVAKKEATSGKLNAAQQANVENPVTPEQNEAKEPVNANPVQTQPVPERIAGEAEEDDAAGNRDSEPVGTGLAEGRESTDRGGAVPASADQSGAAGAGGTEQAWSEPSGQTRDRAGVRPEPGATDDHVIDAADIGKGGLAKKYRDNVAAIKILKALESEGRVATPDERKQLAKYVGWGAMKGPFDPDNKQWAKQHAELKELLTDVEFRAARKSTLDAHYTSPIAVGAMYDALAGLGFTGGRVLEPSAGVGNFFGLMPAAVRNASQLHGVELDSLTSRMVAALYPKAKIAKATGFENFQIPAEYFDVVIGNPPFGSQPLVDAERSPYSGFSIHNYFLAKGIDKLRPGGLMAVVVSHNFLDAQDGRARKWIGERASLIGGVRLPNTAFKENAGTEVVTDILVFQKNDPEAVQHEDAGQWQAVVDQVNVNPKTGESVTHKVNQFFVANPQFILGKPSAGGTRYSANEYTVDASGDLKAQLADWVKSLPDGVYQHIDRKADSTVVDMALPDGVKVGSFYVRPDGKVMQRGTDVMGEKTANEWQPANETTKKRMVGMIELRDTLRQQMRLERSLDASETDIEANRAKLNQQYDAFAAKFGHLNSQTNRRIFLDDTESQLLQALEFDFDKGIGKTTAEREGIEARAATAIKADILTRRVAFPPQDFLTVGTAKDALLASLNYRGKVDAAYMAEVYDKPMAEIVKELGDVVYDDPQAGIVTSDEYLSGDVKTKLAEAKAAAQDDPKYKRNVEALEKVIPQDKKPSEISVSIGAAFVPADIYQKFVKHISGSDSVATYIKATGQWLIDFKAGSDPALNTGKFGTSELSAQELFNLSMLGRGAVVKKTFRNPDGTTTTVLMEKETEAAREKQNAIKAEWQSWLWGDAARADMIAALYNEKMNRIVERQYDGSHMTFPGMNPTISLLAHQKNGVWRGLQSYQVLYDHVVGAGKTFEMATLAMEMRRLGIARKPLFVVPNHLTLQWRSEFTRLYPGSNILAATPEDFSAERRDRLFSKIITGDWDAVVIGHSSLKKIGLPEETEKAVLQEQIDEVAQAIEDMKRGRGDRNIIRDMEGIRARLEAKMKDKLAAIGKRSKVVTFDELGIDAMFIDEMHEFKNLAYNSTMDRNPGMGNPAGSALAFDLFVKTRWLFDTFGAKTPYITATGTPVSNSLVEMYNMQRYMQYPTLKAQGLHVFDAWAKQFGSVENVYEVAPSGAGYRQSTRFAKFTNLPGLMGLYNSFADTITLDDLKAQEESQNKKFPVPKMVGGKPVLVVAKRSPAVAALMGVPKAETTESGAIKFELDLEGEVSITQGDKDKWQAKVGDTNLGQFETEQEARLKIVERAVTPMVRVDPGSILGRFANLRQLTKESKGKVNALSLTGEANKAGLDYRLIDPHAADFPGSKINLAVDNMMRVYRQWADDKGAQLVFCDMSIPLSARSSYSSKDRRLYVRGGNGAVEMKRGTMHTVPGFESLPFFIVQGGGKDAKTFAVYDAASGVLIRSRPTKAEAKESAAAMLADETKRQQWIDKREAAGEIEQSQIDDYNNDNEVEVENSEAFTREDIAGMSGAASFSVYDDIKAKLVANGVPEREIAFIHDYATPVAKDKLFKAVNAGDVRFLLGSTAKMGAGTNVQRRLVGLHHIDAPWRPSDLEQREGRIIRRGNTLYERDPNGFEVFIGRYATAQTYDTRRWQILEHKARGIEQLRNFDGTINEIDDIEGEAANSADMKAAASGDPLILEETKLRNDVKRLERLQAAHADEVLAMTRKARDTEQYAEKYGPRKLSEVAGLIEAIKKNPVDKDGFAPIKVDGKTFKDKETAAEAIAKATSVVRAGMAEEAVIGYRGVEFRVSNTPGQWMAADSPTGNIGQWSPTEAFSASGFVQRMANYVGRLPAALADTKANIEKASKDVVALREQAEQPFAQGRDLDAARDEYKKVRRALLVKGPDVPQSQKADVANGIKTQRTKLEALGFGEAVREFFATVENQDGIKFQASQTYNPTKTKPTETDLKNVRALNRDVANYLRENGQAGDDGVLGYVPGEVRGNEEIRKIARSFGQSVQWFAINPALTPEQQKRFGFFNGAVSRGITFLNASTDRPHLAVLGHEIVHRLRQDNPDLYEEFVDLVRPYVKPGAYKRWADTSKVANTASTADKKHEEFMAEIGSDAFMEQGVWEHIGQNNPALLSKIVEIAKALIATAKTALGYTKQTEAILSDYDKVMEVAADVLGRYMGGKVEAPQQEAEIQFNAKEDPSVSTTARKVQRDALQFFANRGEKDLRTFGAYHRTLSTQFNKALKDPHYGKVFNYVSAMQNEVSLTSIRPAELAPGILHKIDDIKSAATTLLKGRKADKNLVDATKALFAGTLAGQSVIGGKVWSDAELRKDFGLTDTGIALYRQARSAIDASLDELAAGEAYAMAQGYVPKQLRRQIIDQPKTANALIVQELDKQIAMARAVLKAAKTRKESDWRIAELEAVVEDHLDTKRRVEAVFAKSRTLQEAGYAPLMRFGDFTVTVSAIDPTTGNVARDEDGEAITEYFGMFATQAEANAMYNRMRQEFGDEQNYRVTKGVHSREQHRMYQGISPETLALFAQEIGADASLKKYYQVALTERSALKRRLERKNTPGFSDDLPRVLSSFITSNGRFAAQRYYMRDLNNSIKYIPKEKGDVLDEAIKLRDFMLNPNDPAAPVSSVLFAWFLGGSVAAAVVNLSQPVMMTGPYLSQFGVKTATKSLAEALPFAMGRKEITDGDLRTALKRASQEGIVDAQEIFHLYSQGAQGVSISLANALAKIPGAGKAIQAGSESLRARSEAFFTLWGSMFSLAEGFNRKLTFIAAWKVAQASGEKNPYAFAVRAVNETQGIYNKVNRPNWARGSVGRTVLTFKQFSIMYVELLSRMVKRGGPEGKRAALIMLAVLMLAAGEEGLPFAHDLDDLIDAIGQFMGYDTNMKRSKRRLAYEILGKETGDLFLYGISSQLPLDFSNRLGLGNLIPGTGLLKNSEEADISRDLAEIGGPGVGWLSQLWDAKKAATSGNGGKAIENLMPKAVRDVMAGANMATTGAARDMKGRKNMDVTVGDAAIKAVGFQPTKLAEASRARGPAMQDRALHKSVESDIVDMYARGLAQSDSALVKQAEQTYQEWNAKNPETPVRITPDQIRQAARQYALDQNTRLMKGMPKELRGKAGLELIK